MRLPQVLITNTVPAETLAPLHGLAEVHMGPAGGATTPRAEVLTLASQLTAIINQGELIVDHELLDAAPGLRVIANVAAGYNNFDLELMTARGVLACNTPEAFCESTADFTLAMILAVARFLARGDRYVRGGEWRHFEPGVWDGILLRGKTLGIVGYGRTGRAVARRARAFGMRILYTRRTRVADDEFRSLDALLAESDFLSLHTPLTAETRHLLDASRLARMKPGAWLINMARGAVVDEQALVDCLRSGHLAGAALDVFEDEPRVHPALLAMESVVLAPHMGGATRESRHAARLLCAENVALVLQNQQPKTVLNAP